MAIKNIAKLLSDIPEDPWRRKRPFSPEIQSANQELFGANDSQSEVVLNAWLSKHQPCLFGKTAAARGNLSFCFISEKDLEIGDHFVQSKIQERRLQWTRDAAYGDKSGFVVLLISPRIATGLPGPATKALAVRFCSHYLIEMDIEVDRILFDEVFLKKPGKQETVWKWLAGVNYFSAQGDGRWWQDHRIPGGMAFSVNSVGHMVKSGQLKWGIQELEKSLGAQGEAWKASNIKTLDQALVLAMNTINQAATTNSGPATRLLKASSKKTFPACPIKDMPAHLSRKNYCEYEGFYHTDFTLPSEYFIPSINRPKSQKPFRLDFTYIFHDSHENPAHWTMGKGRQIATAGKTFPTETSRASKSKPSSIPLSSSPRLVAALKKPSR